MDFWNFKPVSENREELRLYGVIGRWMDVDEREFSQRLQQVGDKDLDIYVNSDGGSVFTAITIYNMLSRHKGQITFYIDGIAASAMTVITSVKGAKVVAPTGSMMMIHNPLLDPGGPVNAEEMRNLAEVLDKVGGSIAAIYKEKTGLDDAKLAEIMSTDTYLTALEAVDLGFADEVEEQMDIAACITRDEMVINGLKLDPKNHRDMPDSFLNNKGTETAKPNAQSEQPGNTAGKPEAREEKKPMDLEQLKAEHPELYAQIMAQGEDAGVKKERDRIKAIEEMELADHKDLVQAAKFDKPVTAEALAVQILTAQKQNRQNIANNRQADAQNMNDPGADVGGDPASEEAKEKAEFERITNAGKAGFTAKRK